MRSVRFLICRRCGNLVEIIEDFKNPMICCGKQMEELVPNALTSGGEKHIPVVTVSGDEVTVKIGAVSHPMLKEHHIMWIYLLTEHGSQKKFLNAGDAPEATFTLSHDRPIAVYEYCNVHGLWKTEL